MKYVLHKTGSEEIVEIVLHGTVNSAQQFLEIMMNAPSDRIVIRKENLHETFFDLRSGLAGEILQKVVNYTTRLGIVGDFSEYSSKSLQDFMKESNRSNIVVFVNTLEEALDRISK